MGVEEVVPWVVDCDVGVVANVAHRVIGGACLRGSSAGHRRCLGLETLFDVEDFAGQGCLDFDQVSHTFFILKRTKPHSLNFRTSVAIGEWLFVQPDDVLAVFQGE